WRVQVSADECQDLALRRRQPFRQQLFVAPHHPVNRLVVDVDTQHLERANRDLIVGEPGDAELGELEIMADHFPDSLLPCRHACLAGGQQRAIDIPEQDDHAICGTTYRMLFTRLATSSLCCASTLSWG